MSDLERRLREAQGDLLAYIDRGIPPREWLPASDGMLLRGKRTTSRRP